MRRLFLILLSCIGSLSAFAADTMNITVPANAPSFEITLKANPTTGYQWRLTQYDKRLIKLVSSTYQKPQKIMPGAGGTMIFTFKTLQKIKLPDSTSLQFHYVRPWEPGNGSVQNVNIMFK